MSIVHGSIAPMRADKMRLGAMTVPLIRPDIHRVELESTEPLRVKESTIDFARLVAERIIANMGTLPHTEQAGELLALAYAVVHFTGGSK